MADRARDDLLRLLTELSDQAPHLRFGQLVANLATLARGPSIEAIWDAEDDELTAAAQRLLTGYQQRKTVSHETRACGSEGAGEL